MKGQKAVLVMMHLKTSRSERITRQHFYWVTIAYKMKPRMLKIHQTQSFLLHISELLACYLYDRWREPISRKEWASSPKYFGPCHIPAPSKNEPSSPEIHNRRLDNLIKVAREMFLSEVRLIHIPTTSTPTPGGLFNAVRDNDASRLDS